MFKSDQYLATIDTIHPDLHKRDAVFYVAGDLLAPSAMPVRSGVIVGLIDRCMNRLARRSGRRALLEMAEHQLLDIAVSRTDADREASRSRFLM